MQDDEGRTARATIVAAVQIIFGIVIFTSAWWLSADQANGTAMYVFGFITVLLGIVTWVFLSSKNS